MVAINPNIANERKTGPTTPEGKSVSRFNALKNGQYSKLLKELECKYCKQKEQCPFFQEGSTCTLRQEIYGSITLDSSYYDIFHEATELYKTCLSKGLEELYFNKVTALGWIALASKQLDRLMATNNKAFASLSLDSADRLLDKYRERKARETQLFEAARKEYLGKPI